MKNSADPSASVDNTLLDLQNSSYPTKAEFNNCQISTDKYPTSPKRVYQITMLVKSGNENSWIALSNDQFLTQAQGPFWEKI